MGGIGGRSNLHVAKKESDGREEKATGPLLYSKTYFRFPCNSWMIGCRWEKRREQSLKVRAKMNLKGMKRLGLFAFSSFFPLFSPLIGTFYMDSRVYLDHGLHLLSRRLQARARFTGLDWRYDVSIFAVHPYLISWIKLFSVLPSLPPSPLLPLVLFFQLRD